MLYRPFLMSNLAKTTVAKTTVAKMVLLLCGIFIFCAEVAADFDYQAQGTLYTPDERAVSLRLAFYSDKTQPMFYLNQHQMPVDEVPKRFTLALHLTKDGKVLAPDLSQTPLDGFDFTMGKHRIQLTKEQLPQSYPGQFSLYIDGARHHFLPKRPGLIHFDLTDKGIKEIRSEGLLLPMR